MEWTKYTMKRLRDLDRPLPFWELDTAPLAFQLMMLSTSELGLGRVWIEAHKN